jgi:glycosyltransferase involved in cell wall biosynthesis
VKNICFFNSTGFWGGGEKLHFEYALKFRDKRYNVIMFSAQGSPLFQKSKSVELMAEGFKIRNLSFLNPFTIYKLVSFFRSRKIDVVFFSTSQDVKAGGIAAKIAGVPKIAYLRGLAVPIKRSLINRIILKSITTHIIASSEETARMILKNYTSVIPEHKVKVIYHGIDFKDYDNQKYSKIIERTGDEVIIGTVGRLTSIKGQHYLLDVAKKLKDENLNFKLYIAGSGELEEELKSSVKQNGLDEHVYFTGFISDVKSFIHDIDIFVFPSLSEGFGFAVVEAMAACKPVVAFNISTNPEIITDGQTGFLAEFPDTEIFKEKIKLLINDKLLQQEMGKKGRTRVEKSFNIDQKINEIEKIVLKTRL